MQNKQNAQKKIFFYFLAVMALNSIGLGLTDNIFGNFYAEVYIITPFQRGLIEFPRELPGIITVVVISMLSSLGEIRFAIIAQVLLIIGIVLLGVFTPPFGVMLIFLFINSMGMHLNIPLGDSIGLNIIGKDNTGRKFGILNGVRTGAGFVAALAVFLGFRSGLFSFTGNVIHVFLIAAVFFAAAIFLLLKIRKAVGDLPINTGEGRFLLRREYRFYYALAALHGAHKQIAIVFGPWVLIDILLRRADTLAALTMVGMFLGIFFMPMIGKLADRFGVRRIIFAEGFSFIAVYVMFGIVSAGLVSGSLASVGVPVFVVFALLVVDRMTMQLGMIRALYLRSIALESSEISPTLSTGMSIDHVISIVCAFFGGLAWTVWGPQYVFYTAAVLSLGNVIVAACLPKTGDKSLR